MGDLFENVPVGSLVMVKWEDAYESRGPFLHAISPLVADVVTFGVYLGQKPSYIIVAKEIVKEKHIHYNCIPIAVVLDMEVIQDPVSFRPFEVETLDRLVENIKRTPLSRIKKGRIGGWLYDQREAE